MSERFPSFESHASEVAEERPEHLLHTFPVGDVYLDKFAELKKDYPEKVDLMKDVVYTFLDQEIKNTEVFQSKELGAEFPFTKIRVGDLARELFARYSKKELSPRSENSSQPKHIEVIMSSFQLPRGGHQFGYAELVLHETMKSLSSALRDLEAGKEPDDYEIYTFGSPTNEIGEMSPSFLENLKKEPLHHMGRLYGEAITDILKNRSPNERERTTINLTGVSMGASMAAEAGNVLLTNGVTSQEASGRNGTARLNINMYVPAALNDKSYRHAQISLGYAAEGTFRFLSEPGVRKITFKEPEFLREMYGKLPRGIGPRMDATQKKLKMDGIKEILKGVTRGQYRIPENLKVNEIFGVYDPLTFTADKVKDLKKQRSEHAGSLGETIISDKEKPNERVFGAQMSHRIPFYRDNEWKRWDAVADTLLNLKK